MTKDLQPIEEVGTIAPTTRYSVADVLAPGETASWTDMPRIKIPAGGGTTWELPDGETTKALDVIIVHRQLTRAFWQDEFSGGAEPPSCSSQDAVVGVGDPGGSCNLCPMAKFGSDGGKGQRCRLITRLFIAHEAGQFPALLSLPPSAASVCKQYVVQTLVATGLPYWAVRTMITLEKRQSVNGITYSAPKFALGASLSPEELALVEDMRAGLVPALVAMRAGTDGV